ncbi:hypothetical protein BCR32DRAFT_246889 [Anaeromyces robustus]|uniref:Uncharacterized protein n=1 Tax=Anaeromyces robustus TaxID=1754192 RepID=A0A1Y1WZF7_9FUNG|nr:hypothetical protein BCR32DRAFT_246889 [Anaeromyces robustus]|eukprot:ORX78822.1 hypothetical protein BCR32DRAFT_246889 [Anaeromyces robustus]
MDGWYPFLMAVDKNNVDMIKLLMNKSAKSGVILNIQDKDPLIKTIKNNNVEIVKTLLNYAISNDIFLEINEHKPMTLVINNNVIDIAELLIDYTCKMNLIININEIVIKYISKIKIERLKSLRKHGKQRKCNVLLSMKIDYNN